MTEDEAKTKWCPAVRIAGATESHHALTNREDLALDLSGAISVNCIGSACMAWRWGQKRNPDWKAKHQMMAGYEEHPDDRQRPYVLDEENGFCGLAGRTS